jgi:hypothetical protein
VVERVSSRRAWRIPFAIAAAAVLGIGVYTLANASLQTNDSLSSVLAGLIALVTVFVAVLRWLSEGIKPIDHDQEAALLTGALLRRWNPELEHRAGRGDGRTIPLRWKQRDDAVAAPASEVVGSDLRVTVRLDGELSGSIERAAIDLAAGFDSVPNHRLVLLGEPGSGKTFLALTLTVGLLRTRVVGKRVAVLVSLTSWDPVAQSLDNWIEHTLAEENYAGKTHVPAALLAAGLLLPVLDGLDELPDHVRRRAVSRINDTLRGSRPIVLTCRSADYSDVLAAGAPVILRSPVVQVQALSSQDTAHHLRGTRNRPDSWQAVIDHVVANEESPLTTALSTPLMLSLFTAGFRTSDPAELLADPELDTRLAMEDKLVDVLADSLDDTRSGESRRWLTYLAEQLHAHRTPNLSWWRMAAWAPPLAQLAVITLAALLLVFGTAVFVPVVPHSPSTFDVLLDLPGIRWLLGLFAFFVLCFAGFAVGSNDISERRHPGVARRQFVRTLAVGNGVAVSTGAVLAVFSGLVGDVKLNGAAIIGSVFGLAAGVGLVVGLGLGLHAYWAARGHRLTVTTPRELIRHERMSSLVAAGVVALVVGLGTLLAATWGGTVGGHLGLQVAQWRGSPVALDRGFPVTPAHVPWTIDRVHLPALIWLSVVTGLVAGGCVLLSRPWARFGLARLSLAATGQLPLELVAFLDRAHEHELLRISGGSYQFWHIRMQERLVATAPPQSPPSSLRKMLPAATAGVVSLAAIAALIVIGVAQPPSCPDTGAGELDRVTSRVAAGNSSACLGLVTAAYLPEQATDEATDYSVNYLVVAQFDRMTSRQRASLLARVAQSHKVVKYLELADPIPSADVVPALASELMRIRYPYNSWRNEGVALPGMTVMVENGDLRVVEWPFSGKIRG